MRVPTAVQSKAPRLYLGLYKLRWVTKNWATYL